VSSADIVINGPLRSRFKALEEERRRNWPEARIAINTNQRATLVAAHGRTRPVQAGDTVPDARLLGADGSDIRLSDIAGKHGAAIVFFRFAGCPACNIALPYYRDTLYPVLANAGIAFIAVSPQPFPQLGEIAARHALEFPVLSDPGLAFAHALDLTYRYDDASRAAAEGQGDTPHPLNGTHVWELPKPAIIAIDADRRVRFADVSPDWMDRTESETVLRALNLAPSSQTTA